MTHSSSSEFLCGWGAAFINIAITYPVNKIMFRQMLHGVKVYPALRQLRAEGLFYLYRGILPPLFQKTISVSLMFGMFEQFQRSAGAALLPEVLVRPTAALLAGTTEALLTPFERVQTLMQDRSYHRRLDNSWHAARHLRPHGAAEFYRGLAPILLRNGVSNIIFFELRTHLSALRPLSDGLRARVVWDFMSGALIGALTSTLMYPLNVVKTHMQCRVGGRHTGVCATLLQVYRQRDCSVARIYRGVHVNYTRSLISWGIINCSYELLKSCTQ